MKKIKGFKRKEFKKFLEENSKIKVDKDNFEIFVSEAFRVYEETLNKCYELGQFETKSKHPECFYW